MTQAKLANLGALIRSIEQCTPHLLQQTIPSKIVHPNITFRMFPETHMFSVHGITAYATLQKMIQLAVCPFLVPTNSKLDVLSLRITENREIEDRRLHVQWRTYTPDTGIDKQKPGLSEQASRRELLEPGRLLTSLGLLPSEYPVLAGSFEFGFDSQCERILLHVLRNVEYMSKPDSQPICT